MKNCKNCNDIKPLSEFSKNSGFKDGLLNICKICKNEISKSYYENNKEKVKQSVKEYHNKNLEKSKERVRKYYKENREVLLEYRSEYYKKNKNHVDEKARLYNIENKDKISKKKKEYIYHLRKNNLLFCFKERISGLIYKSLKNGGCKKSKKTEEILGCSIEEFKTYIENKFKEGMNWNNKGEWHLDHIIPVSFGKNEEDILELNHFSNFQPLWMIENLKKGNRFIG